MITPSKLLFQQKRTLAQYGQAEIDVIFDASQHNDILPSSLLKIEQIKIDKGGDYTPMSGDKILVLIPLFGGINVAGEEITIGESLVTESKLIANPYEDTIIEFLQLTIEDETATLGKTLWSGAEKFQSIARIGQVNVNVGIFEGREEVLQPLESSHQHLFYTTNGAFEINGCLLDVQDGLLQNHKTEADIEALSRTAVLFWIEMS